VLNSRAWVFQEYYLAPRTLHFTEHKLFWECKSAYACETFPDSYDDGTDSISALKNAWNKPDRNMTQCWGAVVQGYSGGNVTFHKDKLVAVSGIARLFAERFGTTYLAGLWKEICSYNYVGMQKTYQAL
jgi:hypothetical protein